MHLALLHEGRPALLRVEGPAKAPVALFFHPFRCTPTPGRRC